MTRKEVVKVCVVLSGVFVVGLSRYTAEPIVRANEVGETRRVAMFVADFFEEALQGYKEIESEVVLNELDHMEELEAEVIIESVQEEKEVSISKGKEKESAVDISVIAKGTEGETISDDIIKSEVNEGEEKTMEEKAVEDGKLEESYLEEEVQETVIEPTLITSYSNTAAESEMLKLVNSERIALGLQPFQHSESLYSAAKTRAIEITQVFSHTRPDGSSCFTVSSAVSGENLSYSNSYDTHVAYNQFFNSGSHRANMLDAEFTKFACNRVVADGLIYWVQTFGYN